MIARFSRIPILHRVIYTTSSFIKGPSIETKWTCTENVDGSLILTNISAAKQLYINAQCVKSGCLRNPPESSQEEWIRLYFTSDQCRIIKGPINIKHE